MAWKVRRQVGASGSKLESFRVGGKVGRVEYPSAPAFRKRYLDANRPVQISGLTEDWPAMARWSPEYLCSLIGERRGEVIVSANGPLSGLPDPTLAHDQGGDEVHRLRGAGLAATGRARRSRSWRPGRPITSMASPTCSRVCLSFWTTSPRPNVWARSRSRTRAPGSVRRAA